MRILRYSMHVGSLFLSLSSLMLNFPSLALDEGGRGRGGRRVNRRASLCVCAAYLVPRSLILLTSKQCGEGKFCGDHLSHACDIRKDLGQELVFSKLISTDSSTAKGNKTKLVSTQTFFFFLFFCPLTYLFPSGGLIISIFLIHLNFCQEDCQTIAS
jgi:hypothetical protein